MMRDELLGWTIILILFGCSLIEIYRTRNKAKPNIPKCMRRAIRFK